MNPQSFYCSRCHTNTVSPGTKLCRICAGNNARKLRVRRKLTEAKTGKRPERRDEIAKLLKLAQDRANERDLPFNLTREDVLIPEVCPVLGIPLSKGVGKVHDGSPTLDRLVPELGYVKGNVHVISFRANKLKGDGSFEEITRLYNWMKEQLNATEI